MNLWTAVVFFISLSLYMFSAAPVFIFDDNSEFIAAAHRLGITHAPGYPLFSLAGKLFTFLTPVNPYFGVNLVSVFSAAGAVALSFRFLNRITGRWAPAILGACMLMVSRTFWGQAGQAEVYGLNLFFLFLILDIMWGMKGNRSDAPRLTLITLVFLVALINHYTTTLVASVCVPYVIWMHRRNLRLVFSMLLPVLFIAVTICSFWMYLPLRSASEPLIQWRDQSNVSGFVHHIYGVDRRTDAPPANVSEKIKHIDFYVKLLSRQWSPWLLLFVPMGLIGLLMKHGGRGVLIAVLWLVLFSGFIFLLNYLFGPRARYVVSVFHITSMSILALTAGVGMGYLFQGLEKFDLPWWPVFAILAVLIGWSGFVNLKHDDLSGNILAPKYARNLLVNVKRDGIVFSHLETESFPIASIRAVSGKRRDILLYGNQGDSPDEVYTESRFGDSETRPESISELEMYVLTDLRHSRPVYFTFRRNMSELRDVQLYADGLLYQVNPKLGKLAAFNPWDRIDMSGLELDKGPYDYITKNVFNKYYVRKAERLLMEGRGQEAKELFDDILAFNPESRFLHADVAGIYMAIGQFELAKKEYEMALFVDAENVELSVDTVAIYNNLSFVYGKLGESDNALKMMKKAVELAPGTPVFLINLGQTYWEHGMYNEAIKTMEEVVALGHANAAVYNILGICYEKLGLFSSAERNYEKAIEKDPNMSAAYRDYGIYNAYQANNPVKAIELLDKYLELDPETDDKGDVLVSLGILNRQVGDHMQAVIRLKSSIIMGAADTPRRTAIIMSALADSSEKIDRIDDARDAFEKAFTVAYSYPLVYRDYAYFLMRNAGEREMIGKLLQAYLAAVPDAVDRAYVEKMIQRVAAGGGREKEAI